MRALDKGLDIVGRRRRSLVMRCSVYRCVAFGDRNAAADGVCVCVCDRECGSH